MPENPTTALVKTAQSPALARVSNQLALTDKLLTKPEEPFLIPYRKGDKWGFCDRNKNIVIDWADCFSEGLAAVKSGAWGQINRAGQLVVKPEYHSCYPLKNGISIVLLNNKYGYINKGGNPITEIVYHNAFAYNSDAELAVVERLSLDKGFYYNFIDKTGNELNITNYQRVTGFNEGLCGVYIDGKCGFINKYGQHVIPFIYDEVKAFSEGLAGVCLEDKWGYINKNNELVIPYIYDEVNNFSEGLSSIVLDGKIGFIDLKGNEITPAVFGTLVLNIDNALHFLDYGSNFNEGFCRVEYGGSYGLVMQDGDLTSYSGNFGYINRLGQKVIPSIYTWARNFSEGLTAIEIDDKWGFINYNGEEVIQPTSKYERTFCFIDL